MPPGVSNDLPERLSTGAEGTVDLHCHLLPGIDDGPCDLDDAVAMAMQAQADGITAICATPHIRADHAVVIDELPARRDELTDALASAGCATRVLPGGEVAATMLDQLDDRDLAALSLGGSGRWILLEPAAGPLDERLETAVETLRARGFRVLVAHPERHPVEDLIERLRRLVARGALIQATAAHFVDEPTGPEMLALPRAGLVHVLGSDAHSSRIGRPVRLSEALQALATVEPARAHLNWIGHAAPWAIVRGQDLCSPFAADPVAGRVRRPLRGADRV